MSLIRKNRCWFVKTVRWRLLPFLCVIVCRVVVFLFAEKRRPNHIIREMVEFLPSAGIRIESYKEWGRLRDTGGKNCFQQLVDPSFCSVPQLCLLLGYHLSSFYRGADKRGWFTFHEATFANEDAPRAKETFHTTAAQAAEIARRAEVKKLLIGHFSARYEDENVLLQEASAIFPDTQLAKETLCVSVWIKLFVSLAV